MNLSQEEWDFLKWIGLASFAINAFLARLIFGHLANTQKEQNKRLTQQGEKLIKMEITLAKISTKLEIAND